VNRSSNIATSRDLPCRRRRLARAAAIAGLAGLVGCGSGGGTPTGGLICRGEGVVVGGKVTFVKRLYSPQGLTGERIVKPVRYGVVEIVREVDGSVVTTTFTDKNGWYCTDMPTLTSFSTVYPRVASRTDPQKFNIVVTSDNVELYSRPGDPFDASKPGIYKRDFLLPLMAKISSYDFPFSGAFNIMDVLTTGEEKAVELTGQAPADQLFGVWRPGSVFGDGTFGTYFGADEGTNNAYIVLSGGAAGGPDIGDHDEYDDDVILHEFGHFMAYSFSKPAEVGGTHYLNDNSQDIRLSWSEGWATFFSAAIRNSPVMVNTYAGDPGSLNRAFSYSFDIEKPHSDILTSIGTPLEDYGTYTTSEVAVAAALWDLLDGYGEAGDVSAEGLRRVWQIMSRFKTVPPPTVTLETFAGYFKDLFGPTTFADFATTATLRKIELVPDAYESRPDDVRGSAPDAGLVPTCHTLYPAGDVDYAKFTVDVLRPVKVETFNLSNGADTFLQIVDANGAVVVVSGVKKVENDNAADDAVIPKPVQLGVCNRAVPLPAVYRNMGVNNGERLASTVVFDAQAGIYYAKVTASLKGPSAGAGTLGSYGLLVTLGVPLL
jgi:hypothetical protein